MPTSDRQGPIGTSISIMLVGRFWRVLKKCWSGIISNASHPSPKFSCRPPYPGTIPGPFWTTMIPSRDRAETGNQIISVLILYNSRLWNSRILTKWNHRKKWLVRINDVSLHSGYDQFAVFYMKGKDQRYATVFKYVYILKLYVSSIEAWTRLKYWKVIRFIGKLWCPCKKHFFVIKNFGLTFKHKKMSPIP